MNYRLRHSRFDPHKILRYIVFFFFFLNVIFKKISSKISYIPLVKKFNHLAWTAMVR